MSRWLKQVNNLLENLDDTAATAVEQAEERLEEAAVSSFAATVASPGVRGLASKTSVDDILARRGYVDEEDHDRDQQRAVYGDDSAEPGKSNDDFSALESFGEEEVVIDSSNDGAERRHLFNDEDSPDAAGAPLTGVSSVNTDRQMTTEESAHAATGLEPPSSSTDDDQDGNGPYASSGPSGWEDAGATSNDGDNEHDSGETTDEGFSSAVVVDDTDAEYYDTASEDETRGAVGATDSAAADPTATTAPASTSSQPGGSIDLAAAAVTKAVESAEARARVKEMQTELAHQANIAKQAAMQAQEAEKELRKLRRHVVKLNSELEAAESEVDAQRTELERAAERMERDRGRNKEEKERAERERKEERESTQAEHKAAMDSMAARHADRVTEMEEQIRRANEAREQEGGDWNKELEDALGREREVVKKMMTLEEEKDTLTNQVSTLETQMSALQSRIDSVSAVSETATEREREADDRLDAALSLHARQLSQRQAREAELERVVAELSAALAVSRQKEQTRSISKTSSGDANMDSESQNVSLRARIETAEEEVETLRTQLMLEQQRSETLQQEMHEITQERTEEASATQAKQKQYDRQTADMTATISRLQTSLRDLKRTPSTVGADGGGDGISASEAADLKKRVATLSQLVVQHQTKIDDGKVEISTLKSRLRSATSRAEAAERAATMSGNATDLSELERGGAFGSKMRRRGVKGRSAARAKSIRSAMKLDSGRGGSEAHEQIGSMVDALDRWSVETGAYLRSDPLARGVFLLYIVLLHLWALCLLFFHAHNDLDAGAYAVGSGHGPHAAMMQQSYHTIGQLNQH